MSALREIIAHFGVEFDDKALKKGESAVEGFIGTLKGVAAAAAPAFAVKEIYEFIHGLTEQADALAKQSRTMGISLKDMQEWNYAAMMQGVSAETLAASLGKLSAGKYDKKAMAGLGIKPEENGKMKSGAELLGEIADKLSAMPDAGKRNEAAMKVLGRSYKSLMPLLLDGSKGIADLRNEFEDMGGGFTDEFAKDADSFGDNIDRLKTRWKLFGIMVVSKVLPHLVKFTDWLVRMVPKVLALAKITNILQIAAAFLAVNGIMKLSAAIGPLGTALTRLSMKAAPMLPLLALLLAIEDVVTFFRGGDSATGSILNKMFDPATVEWLRVELPAIFANLWADLDTLALVGKIVCTELKYGFLVLSAIVADAFGAMWNGILDGANAVIRTLGKIHDYTGGGDAGAKWAASVGADIDKGRAKTDNTEDQEKARFEERTKLAGMYDKIIASTRAREAEIAANAAAATAQQAYEDAKQTAEIAPEGQKAAAAIAVKAAAADAVAAKEKARLAKQNAIDLHNIAADGVNEVKERVGTTTRDTAATAGYNTALDPDQETKFQAWKKKYAPKDSGADYDFRGAFKEGMTPDAKTGHWGDKFKKPNHETFSDQSQYAVGPDAAQAGRWDGDNFVSAIDRLTVVTDKITGIVTLPEVKIEGPPIPPPNVTVTNNVTVPPGTPESLAKDVAGATAAATLRATAAATIPGGLGTHARP